MAASFVQTIASQTMGLDLSRAGPGRPRDLAGLCTDLFLIAIRMREAEDLGDPAALRKLIAHYLTLFDANCSAAGMEAESVAEAKYALVALLDETVLSSGGPCRDYWLSRPLQLDLYGDNVAGEEFYKKLDKLGVQPEKKRDVLEVYLLCLALGFEGRYKLFNPEERAVIADNLGRTLRRVRVRTAGGLSPHGKRDDAVPGARRRGTAMPYPLWIVGAVCAGGIALLWAVLFIINNAEAAAVMRSITL